MASNYSSFLAIIFISFTFCLIPFSSPIPFILLHGLGDACLNSGPGTYLFELMFLSGSPGLCLEVGNGAYTSWQVPLHLQVAEVCLQVKSIPMLRNGYNIVAQSQGTLIGRGVVEFCDDAPPVINFISLGGPQAGVAAIPPCMTFDIICIESVKIAEAGIYTDIAQATLAPSNYVKEPNNLEMYLAKSSFLPELNNELPEKNATYKERLTRLRNLVLIMFQQEAIVVPMESSWFGFFGEGYNGILPLQKSKLYTEDWLGLRTLDETGRLHFFSVRGFHLLIDTLDTLQYVVPYLR